MTDRVAQVVQHLPSKCGTLSSTPGTSGKKKKSIGLLSLNYK
jgi:hypothetical protein